MRAIPGYQSTRWWRAGATLLLVTCTSSTEPVASGLGFIAQPSNTGVASAISPSVQIAAQDPSGNTVTDFNGYVTLALGTNPSAGVLYGTVTAAAVAGVATFDNLKLDRPGIGYTIAALTPGLAGATSTAFDVSAPATQLAFTVQPANAAASATISPAVVVAVKDAFGNTITSATTSITLAIATNPGGGALAGTTTVSAVNGVATFANLSINNAGAGYTLTAGGAGLAGATSASFNITAAPASQLTFTVQPSNTTAGSTISPAVVVAIKDAAGNTVTSATTSITLAIGTNPGAGTLAGTTTIAAVNGVATFATLSINKAGVGYTIAATGGGLSGATSAPFSVTPVSVATVLAFTVQPVTTAAGAAINPAVAVAIKDASGNTVTSATNGITLTIGTNPGGGVLSGTTTVNAVNGVATFTTLSINSAANGYTLSAAASGLTGVTSATFNIVPGAANQLAFTAQPASTSTGTAISPAVTVAVKDALGNTVTGATTSITLAIGANPGGATLLGTTTVNAVNGVATFANVSLNNAGSGYTLTAAAAGLGGATSAAFNVVSAGSATQVAFSVQPTSTPAGGTIAPAVTVAIKDGLGNTVSGATNSVTLAIGTNPGGGVLSGTTTVSAVNGVATFSNLSISATGAGYRLTAASTGLAGATSAPFDVTAAVPSQLVFSIQPQSTAAFGKISPVTVLIKDSFGNTITSATNPITVAIGTNPGGGTLLGTTTLNAVNGQATFSTLSIDHSGSGYTLGATGAGVSGTSAAFNIVPVPPMTQFSGGFTHTCGLAASGAAFCWGYNGNGLLGIGTVPGGSVANSITPVPVLGGLTFSQISASFYATCAVTTAGAAYCWGAVAGPNSPVPAPVSGGQTFSTVSGGDYHTCGLTTAGGAYCWGFTNRAGFYSATPGTPTVVGSGITFTSVESGNDQSCGVATTGVLYCWGDNFYGELGNGGNTSSLTPTPVSGNLTFAKVGPGYLHSCGLTTGGAIYCWGLNGNGQLGDGTTASSNTPVLVQGGLTFATVTGGRYHSCGLTTAGAAYCWGLNDKGQLGDGTTSDAGTPVAVVGNLTFARLNAGRYHTCGVTTGGVGYCWGFNSSGELGNGLTTNSPTPMPVLVAP